MHGHGVFHRDIKPENILLDGELRIKIADFGFTKHVESTNQGITKTRCGTEPYMCPELFAGKAYSPASADLFALGAVLFIMYAGFPAFGKAVESDPWYRFIWKGELKTFWTYHDANKPAGFYSPAFKALVSGLLAKNPEDRLKMEDVFASEWVQGQPVGTLVEAQQLLSARKEEEEAKKKQ